MDPLDFEKTYHSIGLNDLRMLLVGGNANVTRYMAGWASKEALAKGATDNLGEYNRVMTKLAVRLNLKGPGMIPRKFNFTGDPRVDPNENFYQMTLRRAFEGRASPDEMADAIRIVFLLGMITYPVAAAAYAMKYFGQDCNSFVGNYLGISPYVSIRAYAHGYGSGATIPGATTDIYTCRDLLPLKPVRDLDSIQTGTVLVTFGDPDKNGNRWRHIALVQSFTPIVGQNGARGSGLIEIVEWGQPGGTDKHYTPPTAVTLMMDYKNPELPGKSFLAFRPKTKHYGDSEVRLFLDGSRFDSFPTRGFTVANAAGTLVADG